METFSNQADHLKQPCSHCEGTGKEFNHIETGKMIRRFREVSGISLRELARRVGWSAAHQCDLEKGRRNWNQEDFDRVANCLIEEV